MHRINSLTGLLKQIQHHFQKKALEVEGVVNLSCKESGESVSLCFEGGQFNFDAKTGADTIVLSRRELCQLIFGAHPSRQNPKIPGAPGKLLDSIFPFYFRW